ncbi:DeoR/GlpR family DNA-binding transcription regulator [Limibacter armeniacum]|uniref:DeoR/GlpR family DNA-binding transcription regulator n=1 Tax=Limibacter armeniacum TaxID=466084 RepID=UPI002FE68145
MMLKEERQNYILDIVRKNNKVLSSELSTELNVSEDTIRRDLRELSDAGKIRRVHGGAISSESNNKTASSSYIPFSYEDREIYARDEKTVIAKKAVELIHDDSVVLIDGGTTNLEIVKNLPADLKATFFTNCLLVASKLVEYRFVDVYFLGGKILPNAQVTIGHEVTEALKDMHADIFFLGVRSIDAVRGVTDIDREEVRVKRAMAMASKRVVAVALQEKLGSAQPFLAVPVDKIHTIITEAGQEPAAFSPFRHLGIEHI